MSAAPAPRAHRVVGGIARRRRYTLYAISAGVWLSGALWIIYHYFVRSTDEFGFEAEHPLQSLWLTLHAAFGFGAVWMFGVLWPNHIKGGWGMRRRRLSGGSVFAAVLVLTLSGYALYYIGSERIRAWTSVFHWALGLATLVAFYVHLLTRTRADSQL